MLNGKRFSKENLAAWLRMHIERYEAVWHFDPQNGYAQVKGKGENANRAYGEYSAYRTVLEDMIQ